MGTSNIGLAAALTEAWLRNPYTRAAADDVPVFFLAAHAAVQGLKEPVEAQQGHADRHYPYPPAVSMRKSLANPNRIVSMIDGKAYSSLKRHLKANALTPDQYRERYGLKADYPMVAPGYSKLRSEMAKYLGFGKKRTLKEEQAAEPLTTHLGTMPRRKLSVAIGKLGAEKHFGRE